MFHRLRAAAFAAAVFVVVPAQAQTAAPAAQECELHVWPTENYMGLSMGLLSGFGVIGALADAPGNGARLKTAKDLMREYLSPAVQIEELNKAGVTRALRLDGYRVVVEESTPSREDGKDDPAQKEKVKAFAKRLKSQERLSASTSPCYAELIGTEIYYQKAPMHGTTLFADWTFRRFAASGQATSVARGSVKNGLKDFPPKTPDNADAAKAGLRDAYARDFAEFVAKKAFATAR